MYPINMLNTNRLLKAILLSLLNIVSATAETDIEGFFTEQLQCRQEKLYLTLDRPSYDSGDTIWFRGTLVDANNLSYLVKSNYITVELHNLKGELIQRRKIARSGLCFHHCIPLDADLLSGYYVLSAYTSWMRNFDNNLFFKRKIFVKNRNLLVSGDPNTKEPYDFEVLFFPEGGSLVDQDKYPQKIAFSAVGNDGYPVDVDGVVISEAGEPIDSIHSAHDGMGTFFVSRDKVACTACLTVRHRVDSAGGSLCKIFKLPFYSDKPKTVALQILDDTCRILGTRQDSLFLILHCGTNLVKKEKVVVGDERPLDLSPCRPGVCQLLISTLDGIVLSRRLVFKSANYSQKPPIDGPHVVQEKRSLQKIRLHLEDYEGHSAFGDFAVSVIDNGCVDTQIDEDGTIQSYLLLANDLKGHIHNPAWYFSSGNHRTKELDLLMLTHGWSRFSTTRFDILPDYSKFSYPIEQSEWLSGKVYNLRKKDRGMNLPITIYDADGGSLGMGQLDSLGRFFIGNLNYMDNAPLEIRILSWSKKPYYQFDEPTFPAFSFTGPTDRHYYNKSNRDWSLDLLYGGNLRVLSNVDVIEATDRRILTYGGNLLYKDTKKANKLSSSVDLNIYSTGYDAVRYLLENEWYMHYDENYRHIFLIRQRDGKIVQRFLGLDNDLLKRISADKIDQIEFYSLTTKESPMIRHELTMEQRNSTICSPVINITEIFLRKGQSVSNLTPDRRRRTYQTFGFTPAVEFYHSVYDSDEKRNCAIPDYRKTIYWNPSVQTDRNGMAEIEYYESDNISTSRIVVIEGVAFNGTPVHIEQYINIQ